MIGRLPRRDWRASAPADAGDSGRAHQPGDALASDGNAFGPQPGMDARRAIGPVRSGVDRTDAARQIGVGGRPRRGRTAAPGVIAGGRDLQDPGHCANGIHGLVRAHEPEYPVGVALLSRANQAAAFARISRS